MSEFKPFENDSQSLNIANSITIENGTEEIVIYGDMTIKKDSNVEQLDVLIDVLISIKEQLNAKKIQKLKK